MNIAVFIKEIPLSNNVKIDPKTNNLVRSGEQGRINPYDEHAIEAALQIKEQFGGTVHLITMGPDSFKMSLREGLAMGCDHAYLLSSRAFAGSDTLATSYTLAQAVRKLGNIDILLFGLKAIDADTGQVGPLVAQELKYPQVIGATAFIGLDNNHHTIDLQRTTETAVETIRSTYPIVISVDESMNELRYMSPQLIKHVMDEEITTWNETDLQCDVNRIGMKGSPTIVTWTYIPTESSRRVSWLEGNPTEAAETLVAILKEKHLVKEDHHER